MQQNINLSKQDKITHELLQKYDITVAKPRLTSRQTNSFNIITNSVKSSYKIQYLNRVLFTYI